MTFWSDVFTTVTNPVMAPPERMFVEFRYSFTWIPFAATEEANTRGAVLVAEDVET